MRTIVGVVLVLVLMIPSVVAAQTNDPTAALDWLRAERETNGSYGDEIGATALSVFAFATEDELNQPGIDFIAAEDFSEVGLDEISLTLIALVAIDADVAAFANGAVLARHSALLREPDVNLTDALCLGLIARYNLDLPLQDDLMQALIQRQNEDGGFGQVPEQRLSDVTSTSLCIHALALDEAYSASHQAALNYLRNTQREDDGWAIFDDSPSSDPLGTAFAMMALIASGEPLADWGSPERTLVLFANPATGAYEYGDGTDVFFNEISTIVALPVFRGVTLNSYAPAERSAAANATTADGAPVLDPNWKLVGDGFGVELDSADDFFVDVVDPFTNETLYGVEIINWTADYTYTGYIVESYLPADVLLWMAAQDDTVLTQISASTLALLPDSVIAQLPEEIQARAASGE